MRHNQNGRHMRGRRGNGHHNQQSQHQHHNGGGQQQRRVNPRMQTFDSNGPEVRIRGNSAQINEKYIALARDAMSAGDRVLAESYLQHAEHYQRMINEMNEEYARYQAQYQQQYGTEAPQENGGGDQPQPSSEGMNDLDQSFLGARPANGGGETQVSASGNVAAAPAQQPVRHNLQPKETETAGT